MRTLLPLLAELEDSQPLGHTAAISVDRVMAVAWHAHRLARCRELLAAGQKAPPIHVTRYWLHKEPWYTVGDGNHRTLAAREAGLERIRATIGGENWCQPEHYWLEEEAGMLWREADHPQFGRVLRMVIDVDEELIEPLYQVGVNRYGRV